MNSTLEKISNRLSSNGLLYVFQVVILWYIIFTIFCIIAFINTDWFNNDKDVSNLEKTADAIYYSSTTFSTVGYGDISPTNRWCRIGVSVVQMVLIYITFNIVIESNKDNMVSAMENETKLQNVINMMQNKNKNSFRNLPDTNKWRAAAKKALIQDTKTKVENMLNSSKVLPIDN